MATIYKKRGWWFIEYVLGGKRITKNTRLDASEVNRPKAEKLKKEIMELVTVQSESINPIKNIMSNELSIDKAIKMYKDIYIIGKSKSHTEIYDYVMRRFKEILPGNTRIKNIKLEHITMFTIRMKRELAQATQYTYFQYLASFLAYLKESGYIPFIPIGKGIRPKKAVKNIVSFDQIDLEKILEEAKRKGLKYYQAFKMFLLTGQRPGDVLKLQIRDIDFHGKIVYFRVNKTSSEFKFPIYGKLERFLRDEMELSELSDRDAYLFPGLTVKAVGIAFRKIKKTFGFNKKQYYTLKTFRKNFATSMSRMGMTIQEVQAMLDHKSTSTTLRFYADVKADELKTKIDKLMI
jgi:integrase